MNSQSLKVWNITSIQIYDMPHQDDKIDYESFTYISFLKVLEVPWKIHSLHSKYVNTTYVYVCISRYNYYILVIGYTMKQTSLIIYKFVSSKLSKYTSDLRKDNSINLFENQAEIWKTNKIFNNFTRNTVSVVSLASVSC